MLIQGFQIIVLVFLIEMKMYGLSNFDDNVKAIVRDVAIYVSIFSMYMSLNYYLMVINKKLMIIG